MLLPGAPAAAAAGQGLTPSPLSPSHAPGGWQLPPAAAVLRGLLPASGAAAAAAASVGPVGAHGPLQGLLVGQGAAAGGDPGGAEGAAGGRGLQGECQAGLRGRRVLGAPAGCQAADGGSRNSNQTQAQQQNAQGGHTPAGDNTTLANVQLITALRPVTVLHDSFGT